MKTPKFLSPRTVYMKELGGDQTLKSTYWFTGLVLPMLPFPNVNVPQSLRLEGSSPQQRLARLEDFSRTTRACGLSRAASDALHAGALGGVLHPGIDQIDLLGETATIISRADAETAAVRNELAENLERAVGGFTFGAIDIVRLQSYNQL